MTLWIYFILFLIQFINQRARADECEQFPPEMNMNLQQCCTFANISDPKIENKIKTLVKETSSSSKNNFETACKVAQMVFKEMKLTKDNLIDPDSYSKMIDSKIPENMEFWKQPLKNGFNQCQQKLLTDVTKITELFSNHPFNVKKEECDAQYLVMFMCLHLDSFVNCPEQAWKIVGDESTHKACDTVKSWFGNCGKDLNALKKIVLKSTGMN
ncbi:uncharacterized protein [Chironomus tepperi]|uniref:uncharacterized protein n=1 Tax=Chironomus tepperi TaxID=113505 RepID=UPI00391F37BD